MLRLLSRPMDMPWLKGREEPGGPGGESLPETGGGAHDTLHMRHDVSSAGQAWVRGMVR